MFADDATDDDNGRKIAIIGTGYVGLTTGACLARLGHDVTCADIDVEKIENLVRGDIQIVEDGLEELVREGAAASKLRFVASSQGAASAAEIVFLCLPTPQNADGSADLSYLEDAAADIGPVLRPGTIVVNKSTVPVGSAGRVERALGRTDVVVVSNPEFLREGSAVHDFLNPDRVVIGCNDEASSAAVAQLYAELDTEILITDPASAETIKYAANGFLAMKISFANSVAAMCEAVGADVHEVVKGIGADRRIGGAFLRPGPGWGGSCFPKDSRALVKIGSAHGYDFSLMRGVIEVNDEQRRRMVRKVATAVGKGLEGDLPLGGLLVGALGLTYKAGTDDMRESPSLAIIADMQHLGAEVAAYDPTTTGSLGRVQLEHLKAMRRAGTIPAQSALEACAGVDVVVVLTEWPEFSELDFSALAESMRGDAIVDTRNVLDPSVVKSAGLCYDGVGLR